MYDMPEWKRGLTSALPGQSWGEMVKRLRFLGMIVNPVDTPVSGSSGEATEYAPALEGDDGDLVFAP
jgi:hypothetical protein